jgi:GNAT superfamily N-acetyltransferase
MSTTTEPRTASLDDLETIARIGAAGFYDDPVMTCFPDPDARLEQARTLFSGLGADILPDRGTIHVLEDACMSMWREPGFDDSGDEDPGPMPFPDDAVDRIGVLEATMAASHPHESHWYLNFLSTVPERQGQGLGARTMQPVLRICDAESVPAYLEATGLRNLALYERHGFVQTGEIRVPDGPTLYPMWRNPR